MKTEKQRQLARQQLAAEQAALHATLLALARWRSGLGAEELQLARTLQLAAQANWYDSTQKNFQAWLSAGGFACAEKKRYLNGSRTNENSGNEAAVFVSRLGTHCEESKFSLVRIRNAVE